MSQGNAGSPAIGNLSGQRVAGIEGLPISSSPIDLVVTGTVWAFNEEQVGWELLLQHLYKLPNFRTDWYAVSQPPFAMSETVAFNR